MKFMLIHAVDESVAPNQEICADVPSLEDWVREMTARGILLDGGRLRPVSDATTVRTSDGGTVVTDGPFAETKEQIAGYDLIECRDMDEALAVAAAHPTAGAGSIEVRPFGPGMPTPEVGDPVEGKRRYLMMIGTDMERYTAMWEEWQQDEAATTSADEDAEPGKPDDIQAWFDEVSGIRLYGWELHPSTHAMTVRGSDGRVLTLDGPFAETKEQICGYDLLECAHLDEAIAAAAAHPAGAVELRPLWA